MPRADAQGGVPGYIFSGSVSPFNGTRVISGTKFPWITGDGTHIDMKGGFTFQTQYYNASAISVTVDGHPTTVKVDPTNSLNGTWTYSNASDPITFSGPGSKDLEIIYYFLGSPVPPSQGGKRVIIFDVLKVLAPAPDVDFVGATTQNYYSLHFLNSGNNGADARRILQPFTVTSGSLTPSFNNIYVGYVQNISVTGGSIVYTRFDNFPDIAPNIATLYETFDKPKYLDVAGTPFPPWYATVSVKSLQPGDNVNGNVWTPQFRVGLSDTPNEPLPNVFSSAATWVDEFPWIYGQAIYAWGIVGGNQIVRDGSPLSVHIETVLMAQCLDCPLVFVPIQPYVSFDVKFSGYLLNGTTWVGGYVQKGSISNKDAMITASPYYNNSIRYIFR